MIDPEKTLAKTIESWRRIAGSKSTPWTDRNPNPVFTEMLRQQFVADVANVALREQDTTSDAQFRVDLLDHLARLIEATYRSQ